MKRTSGSLIILALVVAAGTLVVAWKQSAEADRARRIERRRLRQAAMVAPPPFPTFSGPGGQIALESRLVATLAQQAGPYTVSVRAARTWSSSQMMAPRSTLHETFGPGPDSFYLYMQVLA